MTQFKIISLAAFAIGGLVASLIIHHQSQINFSENETLMRQQDEQLATLTAENQRLSNLVVQTKINRAMAPEDRTAELAPCRIIWEVLIQWVRKLDNVSIGVKHTTGKSPRYIPDSPSCLTMDTVPCTRPRYCGFGRFASSISLVLGGYADVLILHK